MEREFLHRPLKQSTQTSHKSRSHLKIVGARSVREAIPHRGSTNIGRHGAKFSRLGDLAPGICALLGLKYARKTKTACLLSESCNCSLYYVKEGPKAPGLHHGFSSLKCIEIRELLFIVTDV
jgi:hypothetical protein